MSGGYDVVIVGGGHNGLVCAAYLGRAKRRVLVVEAAAGLGGCAVSAEFAPGFTVSAGAHILHLLHPKVARDLDLAGHGLRYANADMPTVALDPGGKHLVLPGALTADGSLAAHSASDAANLAALRRRLMRFAGLVREFQGTVPPRLGGGGWKDRLKLGKMAWRVRRLGRDDMREFLRIVLINIADVLDDELESDLLKGAIGLDAVLGTGLGPRSPNSVFSLLYRLAGEADVRYDLLLPSTAGAMLLVECDSVTCNGDEAADVRDAIVQIIDRVQNKTSLAFGSALASDSEQRELFWQLAHNVVPTLYRLKGSSRPLPFVEDMAVPPELLPSFLVNMQNVLKRHQVTASLFGHVGHGQLHLRPFLNLADPEDVLKMDRLAGDLADEVIRVGGTISGEHGDGLSRTPLVRRQYGPL